MNESTALSPLDGRYRRHTTGIASYFSEEALIRYRISVEVEYFIQLSQEKAVGLRSLKVGEIEFLRTLKVCGPKDIARIKSIESTINHDVKAVEYFIKEKLEDSSLHPEREWVHFALTSEDINNCAYALMISESLKTEILPQMKMVYTSLEKFAKKHAGLPMLARTHGQSASPTTLGKECAVLATRLERQYKQLENMHVMAKLNGATGNYDAHISAYPRVNWMSFSKKFLRSLSREHQVKLDVNLVTTQIEPHDSYCEVFDAIRRFNMILIDVDQDLWRYISDGWLTQKLNSGEVGSSAMPHKVNPIDFENSEGNAGLANALLSFFSLTLPTSRLQRDLTDSTIARNFGAAFGYSILAYTSFLKGFSKVSPNKKILATTLSSHAEVLAEAYQTILRREGIETPYEKLKLLTRGEKVSMDDLGTFIESLDVSTTTKKELLALTPENYIGLSEKIAKL